MSTDRDTTRIVRSWLRTDEHESADRVLDAVLDALDTTPQRRATRWPARRLPPMNNVLRIAIGAAAVIAAIAVAINLLPGAGGIGRPDETLTPTPTPVAPLPSYGNLEATTYLVGDPFPLDVSVTLDEGWTIWTAGSEDVVALYKGSPDPPRGYGIILVDVANVYADPCDGEGGYLELGDSVDDFATAIAGQPSTDSTAPVDVTIDGHDGIYLEFTNTGDGPECSGTIFRWPTSQGPRQALVGESDEAWILDVDGKRLVIDAFSFLQTTDANRAEMRDIVESMQIEVRATAEPTP